MILIYITKWGMTPPCRTCNKVFNTIVGLLSPQHQGYKRVEWRLEDFYMERWDIFLLPQAQGEGLQWDHK